MEEEKKSEVVIIDDQPQLENKLNETALDLANKIAQTESKKELDPLCNAFLMNDIKKETFRKLKMDALQDKIIQIAADRFDNRADEMSNKEIIDYGNAISTWKEKSKNSINSNKDLNMLNINNQTVNVNINNDEKVLDKESRNNVIDFINNFLKNQEEDIIDISKEDKE